MKNILNMCLIHVYVFHSNQRELMNVKYSNYIMSLYRINFDQTNLNNMRIASM